MSPYEFSEMFGLNHQGIRRAISKLEPAEVDGRTRRYWCDDMLAAYLEAEIARVVPREDPEADPKRRADLARAEKMEIANAKERGQLVPLTRVVSWKSREAAMLARTLESVPGRVKRKFPDMPGKYLAAVSDTLAFARNEFVDAAEEMAKREEEMGDAEVAESVEGEAVAP